MKQCKVVRIIGTRPTQAPTGWAVYNAPRPLYGEPTWTGDFVHGIFYSTIDPTDDLAAKFAERNAELDAWVLEWVSEEQAITETLARYQAEFPAEVAEIDPADPDHREWLLDCFRENQR